MAAGPQFMYFQKSCFDHIRYEVGIRKITVHSVGRPVLGVINGSQKVGSVYRLHTLRNYIRCLNNTRCFGLL
jgi:hypothetical protein